MKSTTLFALVKSLSRLVKIAIVLTIVEKTVEKVQETKKEVAEKLEEGK